MLFNSYEFIFLFLPITFAVFFLLARRSHDMASTWLALASVFFYAVWDFKYIVLLLASVVFNYLIGYRIAMAAGRKDEKNSWRLLLVALVVNLGLLGYYKYCAFFLHSFNEMTGSDLFVPKILLPLGISFFTFTQIAFLVDCYRGYVAEPRFVHYLLFATYFPHLIAGPILHHKQMMPQFKLAETYRLNPSNISAGLTIFSIGLVKKVLIADNLSHAGNAVFGVADAGGNPALIEAWIGSLAYTLQLYFDFSGYCDMAIGLSTMFNVKLPINFDSPYKATSIIDFWRRWHITLSTFLRDYLYIPLGGNRKGNFRRYVNLFLTMVLGGLWHGAGWTFVFWGTLHGIYLSVNHFFRTVREKIGWTDRKFGLAEVIAAQLITFVSVIVAWVFFKATTFSGAVSILKGMVGLHGVTLPNGASRVLPASLHQHVRFDSMLSLEGSAVTKPLFFIPIGLAIAWFLPNSQQIMRKYLPLLEETRPVLQWQDRLSWRPNMMTAALASLGIALAILSLSKNSEFLYFQF